MAGDGAYRCTNCYGPLGAGRPRQPEDLTVPGSNNAEVTVPDLGNEEIYRAAREVIQAGLARDDSAFTPGRPVWTAVAADDLYRRFVENPLLGPERFIDKFRQQLSEAPQATVQLAAELLYLHLLAPVDIGPASKRATLAQMLAMCPEPTTIPVALDAALDGGFARTGTAYHTYRDRQLSWLIRFVQAWKALPPGRERTALTDPWVFRDVVDSIPISSAYSQRNALLHLAFPVVFESTVSRKHKQEILAAFADRLSEASGDEDRDLLELRRRLEREHGGPISFYRGELEHRWRRTKSPELRGWLVRGANVSGRNFVPDWLEEGYCSLSWPELGQVPVGLTKAQLDARLAAALPDLSTRQRSIHVGVLDRFLNQMRPGDLITTVDGANLYIGTVTGEPTWTDSANGLATHRRTVRWINADRPFTRDQLSASTRDRLSGQMTVSSLGPDTAEFAALADLDGDISPIDLSAPEAEPAPVPVELPDPTGDLATELLVDIDWLTDTIDLLREKKQLVLYGPPGTGKTYLAQELARFLTEQTGGDYRLVQFHPSYSYEDFFEGFRPQVGATPGTITLSLEDGPFKLLVKQAAQDVSRAYVLVIDEINRANLAKVFGELYFLLEYRNRAVQLQYSPAEDFRLPDNLYLIGTMNTADRSIALVDAAMRRRFAWQGLFPGEAPVADMLRKWLRNHNLPADRADLLDALNARIGERDAAIGPSYLMTSRVATDEGLAKVWKHHIMPLLEERHVGEDIDLHRHYGLQALRKGTSWRPTASAGEDLSEETGEATR